LEVEDIIQEAWLALWKALRNGQIEHPEEEAVIYKLFQQLCRWRAQDEIRRRKKSLHTVSPAVLDQLGASGLGAGCPGPVLSATFRDSFDRLVARLARSRRQGSDAAILYSLGVPLPAICLYLRPNSREHVSNTERNLRARAKTELGMSLEQFCYLSAYVDEQRFYEGLGELVIGRGLHSVILDNAIYVPMAEIAQRVAAQHSGDQTGLVAEALRAKSCYHCGDFAEAAQTYKSLLESPLLSRQLRVRVLNDLARLYQDEPLRSLRRILWRSAADITYRLADDLSELRRQYATDLRESERLLLQAQEIGSTHGYPAELAYALHRLGNFALLRNDPKMAKRLYERATGIASGMAPTSSKRHVLLHHLRKALSKTYTVRGLLARQCGHSGRACAFFSRAKSELWKSMLLSCYYPKGQADANLEMANIGLAEGRPHDCYELAKEAEWLAEKIHAGPLALQAKELLDSVT